MSPRTNTLLLGVALLGAGALAVLGAGRSQRPEPDREVAAPSMPNSPATSLPHAGMGERLPPDHPPIGANANPHGAGANPHGSVVVPTDKDEPPALVWKAPASWKSAPNPNAFRVATYRITEKGESEVTVSRAGGATEANLQRWVGQFDDAGPDKRTTATVKGLKVTTVTVEGTYRGMVMGPKDPAAQRPAWALAGAVVETPQGSYFFKLTGPAAEVRAAKRDFDALVASVSPAP